MSGFWAALRDFLYVAFALAVGKDLGVGKERERRRADDAETSLDLSQRADKTAADHDALSAADKLLWRERHGVYRD